MDGMENFISVLDYILDTKRKRHIIGGILVSASLLFGGLALTVMTIKSNDEYEVMEDDDYGRELLVYTNVFLSNLDHAPNFSRIRKTDMSF